MYGKATKCVGHHYMDLGEVMYYLYLPIAMPGATFDIRLPPNLARCRELVERTIAHAHMMRDTRGDYVYISARKGWATPDNPLNRPGWHCDGFGTDDLNYVWWKGPGTRFAIQSFAAIEADHVRSMAQFEEQVVADNVWSPPESGVYMIDPYVVHATPIIAPPGCWRQYVKISFSKERYNLENNSHNYLFDYSWKLHTREALRNDPHKAQRDFA